MKARLATFNKGLEPEVLKKVVDVTASQRRALARVYLRWAVQIDASAAAMEAADEVAIVTTGGSRWN